MARLAIFVSGEGTNCENLIRHFQAHPTVSVVLVVGSRAGIPALARATRLGVETLVSGRAQLEDAEELLQRLRGRGVTHLVLAGFLLKMPESLLRAFPDRVINIHPALLPKYGGRGMYGRHVHEAVKAAGERETGITVHYVDATYDTGRVIAQYRTALEPTDSVADIERKVHALEQRYFPSVVEQVCALTDNR